LLRDFEWLLSKYDAIAWHKKLTMY